MSRSRFDVLERYAPLFEAPEPSFKEFLHRRERKQRNRRIVTGVVALAVAAAGIGGVARMFSSGLIPAGDPRSPFLGTWVTSDDDGSTPTMTVGASGEGAVEIVVHDDLASVCSGAPSTMKGTGRLEGAGELVIPSPVLVCDDGTEARALSGPPLEEQLRNLTFVHGPEADALTDNLGQVWQRKDREGARMWPQSDLDEVQEAQELADAGDPRYTWQVDPKLAAGDARPYEAEIFARFLREELGWQEFRGAPVATDAYLEGSYDGVVFLRCAPGRTNPLYPNDPEGRGCAPTIDELRYETVAIDVKQLTRRGPTGIWVVTGWVMLPPSDEPMTPFSDLSGRQFEQVVPPTDAEVTGLLEAFLQARIDGEGAQGYVHSGDTPGEQIPLLYATSSGAPYERSEIERVEGPHWPGGGLVIEVRLFAEGGTTVVEQVFFVDREGDGRLGLVYAGEDTKENGEVAAHPYSILDGQVTFSAPAPPWRWAGDESAVPELGYLGSDDGAEIGVLPNSLLPDDCGTSGGATPSARALVRAIRSNPGLEATKPVSARVGGTDALRLDVAAVPGAATCFGPGVPVAPSPYAEWGGLIRPGDLGRLYVLDLPEGIRVPSEPGPARTLTILIRADEDDFERAVASAAPILDSFEFHAE